MKRGGLEFKTLGGFRSACSKVSLGGQKYSERDLGKKSENIELCPHPFSRIVLQKNRSAGPNRQKFRNSRNLGCWVSIQTIGTCLFLPTILLLFQRKAFPLTPCVSSILFNEEEKVVEGCFCTF